MRLYNDATGQYADVSDRAAAAWMRGLRGWRAADPPPEPVEEDEAETAAEPKSRGKSSARTKKED